MTDHDRLALMLAARPYRHPARREADALDRLSLTPTRFWALVGRLLDDPDAEREMPAEVRRLRRLRDARRMARSALRTTKAPRHPLRERMAGRPGWGPGQV